MTEKKCNECGATFQAERATRRYCSDTCRKKFHRGFWNDPSHGTLSRLLRQVADGIDHGQAMRAQVTRLRVMLGSYERDLMARELSVRYPLTPRRRRKAAS
jgi:hypothetical protein